MRYFRDSWGFTLVEMMVVVAIIAALMLIALPAYNEYGQRSRRGDAVTSLLRAQFAQEQYRGDNTSYGALADIGVSATSQEGYYTLAVTASSAAAYTITAAPAVGGAQVGDDCGTFAINQDGPLYTGYASADCWGR